MINCRHARLNLGGNGRIARAMTRMMLARSWTVTSIIRSPRQAASILELGDSQPVGYPCAVLRPPRLENRSGYRHPL